MSDQLRLDLLSLGDHELKMFAGEATHQHYKGGLYRLLGVPRNSANGLLLGELPDEAREILNDPQDQFIVVYEHLFPHQKELWVRYKEEYNGVVDCPEWHPMYRVGLQIRRFRPIGCEWEVK